MTVFVPQYLIERSLTDFITEIKEGEAGEGRPQLSDGFVQRGLLFLTTQLSFSDLCDVQLTFRLRLGMINAPWHSFHVCREGQWYLFMMISTEISKI